MTGISIPYSDFFVGVALIVLGNVIWRWIKTIYALHFAKFFRRTIDYRQQGEWAVITGATEGLGKAFAEELAGRGLKVVVLARNLEKLQQFADEIDQLNVEVRAITVDFATCEDYTMVQDKLAGLDVAVLVNNVGMCPSIPEYFHEMDEPEFLTDSIRCNAFAMTAMTRIVLPGMMTRKRGVIVSVASASAILPTPLVAIYSATKAYVDFFSRALVNEVAGSGVIIQSLLPFTIRTKMTGNPDTSFWVTRPKDYAKSSLDTVGILDRSHGILAHSLQQTVFSGVVLRDLTVLRQLMVAVAVLHWLEREVTGTTGCLLRETNFGADSVQ